MMRTGLFTLVVVVVAAVACSFPDGIVVVVTADASSSSSSSTGSSTRKNPELTFGMTATQNQLGSATTKTGSIKAFLDVSFVPTIKWTHSGNVAGYCDYAAGIDAKEEANAGLSFGIFGLLQRTFGGRTNAWNVRARLDTESSDLHCVDVTLMAQGGPSRILLRAQGTVDTLSRTGEMTDASVEQPLASLWGGEAVVSTRYSFVAHRPNVVVAYGKADTCVTVSGDAETQCVTIRQRSLDGNREIAPTVSTDGSVEFEYVRRNFGGRSGRTVTAVYKPEKAVTLICDEWPWSAKAVIPVDGYCNALLGGAKLTLQRSIE